MTWIYSRAMVEAYENCTSLPELVAASSLGSCLGTEQSAPSSGSHTHKPCLWHDKTMEHSRLSRFGMTCKPLTAIHGAELLTSWLAAFRVKTSALPETAQELTESVVECGTTWPGSLAKFDPDTSSWKTAQRSLLEDWAEFSETWPRWGLMRAGECWERQTLVPRTSESASGFWPTPTHSPRDASCTMETAIKWNGVAKQDSLSFAVAREEKAAGRHMPHGQLNPTWVEWLMGWPTGWTDLKPLETARFREWQQQHGPC